MDDDIPIFMYKFIFKLLKQNFKKISLFAKIQKCHDKIYAKITKTTKKRRLNQKQ